MTATAEQVKRTDITSVLFGPEYPFKKGDAFLDKIGRSDIKEALTPQTPILYVVMEAGLPLGNYTSHNGFEGKEVGFYGLGGLGILAGDTLSQTSREGLPMLLVSPYYTTKNPQVLTPAPEFWQDDDSHIYSTITPEEAGLKKISLKFLKTVNDKGQEQQTAFEIYAGTINKIPVITAYNPGFGRVYEDKNNSDHRLYQDAALIVLYKALAELGINPSKVMLNEAATLPFVFAQIDHLCKQGKSIDEALALVKEKFVGVNHTLVPAASPCYSFEQFEKFILPNIESNECFSWLSSFIYKHKGNMSNMFVDLMNKLFGVSEAHAKQATRKFGKAHEPITNGIDLTRWINPKFLALYQEAGLLDEFELPTPDYQDRIATLDEAQLRQIKAIAKIHLTEYLQKRKDQYGNPITIPPSAKIAYWTRRIVDYKRPWLPFMQPERLAQLLETHDIHLVMGGKTHPTGDDMKKGLQWILQLIDGSLPANNLDPETLAILKKRVHFVQDYDPDVAKHLAAGGDIFLNTPIVYDKPDVNSQGQVVYNEDGTPKMVKEGTEACGTSHYKADGNCTIVVSTADGGVAEVKSGTYLEITGGDDAEQAASMYEKIEEAALLLDGNYPTKTWGQFIKDQLAAAFSLVCAARMEKDQIGSIYSKSPNGKDYHDLPNAA